MSAPPAAFCDQCGWRLDAAAATCPRCATPVTAPPPAPQSRPAAAEALPSGGRRIRAGAGRNLAGSLAGLAAAWFNVPLILFMAGVGAVFGGVAGLFSGTLAGPGMLERLATVFSLLLPLPIDIEELLPTAAIQIGGIVGALVGIATGAASLAWLTAAGFWQLLYAGDPMWPLAVAAGQVVLALVVGASYTGYATAAEGWRLRIAGVRRPSRREAAWLQPMVDEAARRLGARGAPVLRIDDSTEPNATAGIRHIVVATGLLEYLRYDTEAVAGVIAHEVAHWRSGDAVTMAWGKGTALPLALAYGLAVRVEQAARWGPLRVVVWLVLWSVNATMRGLVVPVHARFWRRCEYAADAAASRAGYGEGLYRALAQLRMTCDGARSGWEAAMCATHPPTELRLERLEAPGRTYSLPHDPATGRSIQRPRIERRGPDKD